MIHTCRHCDAHLSERFLDLGHAPLSNAYLDAAGLQAAEVTYPLRLNVCTACRLVQTEDYTSAADVFGADYAYFSSTSSGWVAHAKRYTDMIVERLDLGPDSFVIELAANDGYLLQHMKAALPRGGTHDCHRRCGTGQGDRDHRGFLQHGSG